MRDIRWLLVDASAVSQIDSSAAGMLGELWAELHRRGIKLGLAELHAEARDMLQRAGVIERIGSDMSSTFLRTHSVRSKKDKG